MRGREVGLRGRYRSFLGSFVWKMAQMGVLTALFFFVVEGMLPWMAGIPAIGSGGESREVTRGGREREEVAVGRTLAGWREREDGKISAGSDIVSEKTKKEHELVLNLEKRNDSIEKKIELPETKRRLEKGNLENEYLVLDPNVGKRKGLISHCPKRTFFLEKKISHSILEDVAVQEKYFFTVKNKTILPGENCEGLNCPYFGKCNKERSVAAAICRNPEMADQNMQGLLPLKALPLSSKEATEKQDQSAYEGDLYLFENVYFNQQGEIFNESHHFLLGGCYYLDDFHYEENITKVTHFEAILNLVNWNSANIFHTVAEFLPELLISAKVLSKYEGIPVAFRETQDEGLIRPWLELVAHPIQKLNIHFMENGEIFFAEKLISPARAFCARPSNSILQLMRSKFFLKFPNLEETPEMSEKTTNKEIVLFGRRPKGKSRFLPSEEQIISGLEKRYSKERVKSFYGNLSVTETRELFRFVKLYISAHGAGLTNMVFLAPKTPILEIRPDQYANSCYHYLAERCQLSYFSVTGLGDFSSQLNVDSQMVLDLAFQILPALGNQ